NTFFLFYCLLLLASFYNFYSFTSTPLSHRLLMFILNICHPLQLLIYNVINSLSLYLIIIYFPSFFISISFLCTYKYIKYVLLYYNFFYFFISFMFYTFLITF